VSSARWFKIYSFGIGIGASKQTSLEKIKYPGKREVMIIDETVENTKNGRIQTGNNTLSGNTKRV